MAAEDYLASDYDDGRDEIEVRCKYCGERDLFWLEVKGKWRLANAEGWVHSCQPVSLDNTADDFGNADE